MGNKLNKLAICGCDGDTVPPEMQRSLTSRGRGRVNTEPQRKKFSPLREFPSEDPDAARSPPIEVEAPQAYAAHPSENMCPMMMPIRIPFGAVSANSSKDSDMESNAEIASMTALNSGSPEATTTDLHKVKESYKDHSSEASDYLYD